MPGIFGFLHHNPTETNRRMLNQMAEALHDEPSYQIYQYIDDEIGLGRVGLDIIQPFSQPAWNESGTVAVMMEGEIYDYRSHRDKLESKGHDFQTDGHAELFAHYYEESGENFVNNLNGAFVAVIWDKTHHQLTIVNDHLGLQPLYYTPNCPDRFVFASGVRAILADSDLPRTLDHLAIAQFLTFDHVLGDRTLLTDVKNLPGASILTLREGNLSIKEYWRAQYPDHYPIRSELEYIEELLPLLRKAVSRQMPGQHSGAILLSGGLDSRIVAALLNEQRENDTILTFTMGQPGCDDERYAREVSKKLGSPHFFFQLEGNYLLKYANHGVRLSDGLANVVHMHTLPNLAEQAKRAQVIYKGFLGDALIGYGITDRLWSRHEEDQLPFAQFAVHRDQGLILFEPEQVDRLLMQQPGDPFSQQVMTTYAQALQASRAVLPADQRNYFDLCQRVPRMTRNGVDWVRSQAHVRLPFADKELVEFMLTVPPGYRNNRAIIKDLFIRQFPELAKIPYTETNYPMVHCRREVMLRADEQLRWWLRSLGMQWVPMPIKRSYARYNEWLRTDLKQWMEDILLSKQISQRGIFNPAFLKSLVAEHMSGQNHYTRLGAPITIELWIRQFIDNDSHVL